MRLQPVLKLFFTLIMLILVSLSASAQSREVKGTILDSDGITPIAGATVQIKGTTIGSASNVNEIGRASCRGRV